MEDIYKTGPGSITTATTKTAPALDTPVSIGQTGQAKADPTGNAAGPKAYDPAEGVDTAPVQSQSYTAATYDPTGYTATHGVAKQAQGGAKVNTDLSPTAVDANYAKQYADVLDPNGADFQRAVSLASQKAAGQARLSGVRGPLSVRNTEQGATNAVLDQMMQRRGMALGILGAQSGREQFNKNLGSEEGRFNSSQEQGLNMFNTGQSNSMESQNVAADNSASAFMAGAKNTAGQHNTSAQNRASEFSINTSTEVAKFNKNFGLDTAKFKAADKLARDGMAQDFTLKMQGLSLEEQKLEFEALVAGDAQQRWLAEFTKAVEDGDEAKILGQTKLAVDLFGAAAPWVAKMATTRSTNGTGTSTQGLTSSSTGGAKKTPAQAYAEAKQAPPIPQKKSAKPQTYEEYEEENGSAVNTGYRVSSMLDPVDHVLELANMKNPLPSIGASVFGGAVGHTGAKNASKRVYFDRVMPPGSDTPENRKAVYGAFSPEEWAKLETLPVREQTNAITAKLIALKLWAPPGGQ